MRMSATTSPRTSTTAQDSATPWLLALVTAACSAFCAASSVGRGMGADFGGGGGRPPEDCARTARVAARAAAAPQASRVEANVFIGPPIDDYHSGAGRGRGAPGAA